MISVLLRLIAISLTGLILFGMQRTTPGYADIVGPIPQAGRIGEVAAAPGLTVKVGSLRLAHKLRWRAFGRTTERDTGGLWAVVEVSISATRESLAVMGAALESAQGLRFEASQRMALAPMQLLGARAEPGLPRRGFLVFELPVDAAAGATLLISRSRWPRLETQLRIALPLESDAPLDVVEFDGPRDG